jgi:hypothetical protein
MYAENTIFVISDKGLTALENNEIPPSVFTSILRLVDGKIPFKTFSIFLKEHGDIQPLFEFLHSEGLINELTTPDDEIRTAPNAVPFCKVPIEFIALNSDTAIKTFDSKFFRQTVHQYVVINHPHIVVGIMSMLDSLESKHDFANYRELYARLIAGDKVNANHHMAKIDTLLALPD